MTNSFTYGNYQNSSDLGTNLVSRKSALEAGSRLFDGRYRILRVAGNGGFGITYKGLDQNGDEVPVAIKEYFPKGQAYRDGGNEVVLPNKRGIVPVAQSVIIEALNVQAISHPNVARLHRSFLENGTGYLVFDWVEGATLRELRHSRVLDYAHLLKIYLTVLDAILHFTNAGLVHRDLSWNNIMLRSDGEPIIVDFGLARAVGDGFTHFSRTVGYTPGFAAPEQKDIHGQQGPWTDIYTLSATVVSLLLGSPPRHPYGNELRDALQTGALPIPDIPRSFIECIERGLEHDPSERLYEGPQAIGLLGLGRSEVAAILSPSAMSQTLLFDPRDPPKRVNSRGIAETEPKPRVERFQRSLLQSFDTARFQPTAIRRADGKSLASPMDDKIALARTEAVLNILFGREIVVPAGQIAESPAFKELFLEIHGAYDACVERIAAACERCGLPTYLPFRLALQDSAMRDYTDFVEGYEYTGAPLVLLSAVGKSDDGERARLQIEYFKALFIAGRYDELEKATGREDYARFTLGVRKYFRQYTATYARQDIPPVDTNDYALWFRQRLGDERLAGSGVSHARDSLSLVAEIEARLQENNLTGMRGNWYVFADKFEDVWPLARAYLDTRLFLTLARQYEIDHPIFITQEFEYGKYDHSLVLGPGYDRQFTEASGTDLLEISSYFTRPIDWDAVFALYENDRFVRSIRRMNQAYFAGRSEAEEEYADLIESHGMLLTRELGRILSFEKSMDRLMFRAGESSACGKAVAYEGYDPNGLSADRRSRDRAATKGFFGEQSGIEQSPTAISTLTLDKSALRDGGASAILHYFAKPYRLFTGRVR